MATPEYLIGQPGMFNPDRETWVQYSERMAYFFQANGVAEGRKKAMLLSLMGPTAYKLLRSLIAPSKPDDKSYAELVSAMEKHHDPIPSEIVQRYKFNSRVKKPEESVSMYLFQLRALAEHCNYGNKLDEMLRDRLVCGVEVAAIQKRLLAEPKLTLKRATEIAMAMETAEKNAETLKEGTVGESLPKQPIHGVFQAGKKGTSTKPAVCYRCGQKSHKATTCPYKETKCHKCGKVGHLQKVCRQGVKQVAQTPSSAQGKKKGMNLVESVATTYSAAEEYGLFPVQASA